MGFPPHAVLHRWLESYGHRLPGAGGGAGLLKEAQGNLGDNEEVLGFFFFHSIERFYILIMAVVTCLYLCRNPLNCALKVGEFYCMDIPRPDKSDSKVLSRYEGVF